MFSSENDNDEYSDNSDSDIDYTTKKGCNKKKPKLEEKLNNSRASKRKRTKRIEVYRDIQSNDIKRVASLRSTNVLVPNNLETKGMLIYSDAKLIVIIQYVTLYHFILNNVCFYILIKN